MASRLRVVAAVVAAAQRWSGLLPDRKFRHLSESYRNDLKFLVRDHSSHKLSELRGIHGVAQNLKTDLRMGIGSVTQTAELLKSRELNVELALRRHVFGMNNTQCIKRQSKMVLIWQSLKKNCRTGLIQIVYILCGVVFLALSIADSHIQRSVGLVLLFFTILNAGIETGIDVCLSNRLEKLAFQGEKHIMQAHVIRCGRRWRVSTCEIVVGDLVELCCGDRIPADGLLVESHSLQIIEGTNPQDEDTACLASTFLTFGSIVHKGFGLMLVTAVGKDTQWSAQSDTSHQNPGTVVPAFLTEYETSKDLIEKLKLYIALLFLLILLPFHFTGNYSTEINMVLRGKTGAIFKLVYEFYDGLTYIMSLAPSSLFCAVSLSLLYFIPSMSADRAFILNLQMCYTKLGSITTICTGKAGLLTHAEMEVKSPWIAGAFRDGGHLALSLINAMPENIRGLLFEGLVLNSTGNLYRNADSTSALEESCAGSRTEKALLRWGQAVLGWGTDDQSSMGFDTIKERYTVLKVEPFDCERKRSGASLRREADGNCIVHWKGAAETILSSCSRWICADAESGRTTIMRLSERKRSDMEEIITNMENIGMRCVALAYCEVGPAANSRVEGASGHRTVQGAHISMQEADVTLQEVDLTLLAVVGMKETCRPEATEEVAKARNAGLKVIMVTGDSVEAARAIAKECGIIEESGNSQSTRDQVVDGSTFRGWTKSERKERLQQLTVLARASVRDKRLLVKSLQADDQVVAVTGYKHMDVAVLQKADVGFSLGCSGKQVAKESSDIILLDDSFMSLLKAIEWGRCIHCNLQYFIHFTLAMAVGSSLISTLTGTQFQWIDLIKILATIAVIRQPPLPSLMLQPPIPQDQQPLYHTNVLLRNVSLQGIYQVILFSMMISYDNEDLTRAIIFNTFIFCQLINLVNARQRHIFQSLLHMDTSQGLLLKVKIFLRWCRTNKPFDVGHHCNYCHHASCAHPIWRA